MDASPSSSISPRVFIETNPLPPGTFSELFSHLINSETFNSWAGEECSFQLCCVGAPGTGKTTLSAMVVHELRQRYPGPHVGIASIFFKEDVKESQDTHLLQAFLESLYSQLAPIMPDSDGECLIASCMYARYNAMLQDMPSRIATFRQLNILRKAIYSQLLSLRRALLVVDDFDLYQPSLIGDLELELSNLQRHGLSIMTTSRLSQDPSGMLYECDVPNHGWEREVTIFWACKWCWSSDQHVICHQCKQKGVHCRTCGDGGHLFQPTERIKIDLSIPDDTMSRFINWDLEREHGDLGLHSPLLSKPPLSRFGRYLRKAPKKIEHLKKRIILGAEGNITFAKLSLDSLLDVEVFNDINFVHVQDRLPEGVIAYYDALLAQIRTLPEDSMRMSLGTILAVAQHDHILFDTAQEMISQSLAQGGSSSSKPFTLNEVLRATRGLVGAYIEDEQIYIFPHHAPAFMTYANENYDEALFWEASRIRLGKLSRSTTWGTMSPTPSRTGPLSRSTTWRS